NSEGTKRDAELELSEEAAKAANAERKASKRQKKEAKETASAAGPVDGTLENGAAATKSSEEAESKEARRATKAARKEEKARLKELKSDKKKLRADSSTIATPAQVNGATDGTPKPIVESVQPAPSLGSEEGYVQDPSLTALPESHVNEYLASNFITITDPTESKPANRPITEFKHLPAMPKEWRAPLSAFKSPTPIQAAAWPSLFAGRDVVGVAETGSGKTIAFGLPCIRYLAQHPSKSKKLQLRACIVSPTRELAMQIYDQLVKLAEPAGFSVAVVYGGVPKDQQREALKTASIVVATPGRLNDLINEEAADLSSVGYLVLDEADRMLDKGFEQDIKRIISFTRQLGRQTLMFTATWPESVRDLASTFMQDPVKISIGDNPTGELRANTRITQIVQVVEQHDKQFKLLQLLKEHQSGAKKNDRILVFCLYKKEASRIELFI
ncbi:RNA-dependent ATPase, partial [Coniosporium uncinatum]